MRISSAYLDFAVPPNDSTLADGDTLVVLAS